MSTNTLTTYFVMTDTSRQQQNPESPVTIVVSIKADSTTEKRNHQRQNIAAHCARYPHRSYTEVNALTEAAARLHVRPNLNTAPTGTNG